MATGREQATVAVTDATTLAGVMHHFWIAARHFAEEGAERGSQRILALPCFEKAADPKHFQAVLQHITDCAEVCEYVGESLMVAARHPAALQGDEPVAPCPMLLLRSFRQAARPQTDEIDPYADVPSDEYDPYADVPSDDAATDTGGPDGWAADEEIMASTRAWVEGVIVKMKVCPFSATADMAGIPVGGVTYPICHGTTGEEVYEAFWGQCQELAATDQRDVSTVLLLTPRFALHSGDGYDALANTLNGALTSLQLEDDVQLVFFHPEFAFRDGKDRIGSDGAANYARRSPYPMINLLRTPQVRDAQKNIPTGSVYEVNEKNLQLVGPAQLQEMLETRDWGGIYEKEYTKHSDNLWGAASQFQQQKTQAE